MSRMKTFFTYAIIIVVFYFLSNILINLFIKGTYKKISGEVLSSNIEIIQAKATYVNGYIDGKITNNSQEEIINKYVKIDIFSERGICLGTKYVEIAHLNANESIDFHMGYKFTDSNSYKISIVDNMNELVTDEQLISDEMGWYLIAATIIVLMFV